MSIMNMNMQFAVLEKREDHGDEPMDVECVGEKIKRFTEMMKYRNYDLGGTGEREGRILGSEKEILKNVVANERQSWDEMFDRLLQYWTKHGDCLVPMRYKKDPKLRAWVSLQRRSKSLMCATHRERLDAIGFCWEGSRPDWNTMFQRLVEYKHKHGDCLVSQKDTTEQKLGTWVDNQRRKKNKMPLDHRRKLESIGFVWAVRDPRESWDSMFERLLKYKAKHGNCIVPAKCWEDEKLGHWVTHQRRTKYKLSIDRFKRLDGIGFVWGELKQDFNIMFDRLVKYKEEHGHLFVPRYYDKDPLFGRWVCEQRAKKDDLSDERRSRLDSIGFIWNPSIAIKKRQNPVCECLMSKYCTKRCVDRLGGPQEYASSGAERNSKRAAIYQPYQEPAIFNSRKSSSEDAQFHTKQGAKDSYQSSPVQEKTEKSRKLQFSSPVQACKEFTYTSNRWLLPVEEEDIN